MSFLKIITLPDPRLKIKSEVVTHFDASLKKLIQDMYETMIEAQGIGLAAVQVAIHKRIIILDIGDSDIDEEFIEGDEESERKLANKRSLRKLEVFINPIIVKSSGHIEYEEGCLSVPGIRSNVNRKEKLVLRYQDEDAKFHETETTGLRSIVIQHEIDHCDGIVFTDRLGPMQRMMLLKKYEKLQEEEKEKV